MVQRLLSTLVLVAVIATSLVSQSQGQFTGGGGAGALLFAGVPTGACTSAQTAVNTTNGDFYDCNGGTWSKVNGGGVAGAGGTTTQIQRNNGGVLAGVSSFTSDGTVNTALAGADWRFADPADSSKKIQLDLSGLTTANTRTVTAPDANAAFAVPLSCTNQVFSAMSASGVFTCHSLVTGDIPDLSATYVPVTRKVNGHALSADISVAYSDLGNLPVANLNSGTSASSSTFWRGDGTWATPAGGGNTTSTTLTTNRLPKANGANSIIDSSLNDDGTTVSTTEPFSAASIGVGASPPTCGVGVTGCVALTESAGAGTPLATVDYLRANSTLHAIMASLNGGSETPVPLLAGDLGGTSASPQVTATHLAAALPTAQGGSGTASTLVGVMRGGSPMTAAELSGDATTSGSNVVTVVKVNGGGVPVSASVLGSNGSSQPVAATSHGVALTLACNDASGSGTAQTCTTSPTFVPAAKDCINYTPGTTNTAALTLNVNSSSAAPVQKWLGTALASGDMVANKTVTACYDGTNWLVDTIGNAPSGGAGTPGGASGTVQVNNAGAFGGINGSSFSNNANLATGNITSMGIAPVAPTGAGSTTNTQHALDIVLDDTVSSVGSGTDAGIYAVCNNHATGGSFGHELCIVARAGNETVGASVSAVNAFYGSYTQTSSDTVAQAGMYSASDWTVSAGTTSVLSGFSFGVANPSGTGVISKEDGGLFGVPAAAVTNLTQFEGLNIGNCDPITGSTYIAAMFCGLETDYEAPINIKMNPSTASTAPMTQNKPYAINERLEVDGDVSGGAFGLTNYMFGLNGSGTISAITGAHEEVDEANVGTLTTETSFEALTRSTGGGTVSNAFGLRVLTPTGGGTFTNVAAINVQDQTAALTETNAPFAIKTEGSNDIVQFAGPVYANGNIARVTADFTDASSAALQNITGLSFVLPKNTAINIPFHCSILYSQATAAVADSFGIKASVAPTNIMAKGEVWTSASAVTAGNLPTLTTTTATAFVTFTPSAITTVWNAELYGMIENPSGAANTINFLVSQSTAADLMTIKKDSYCKLGD